MLTLILDPISFQSDVCVVFCAFGGNIFLYKPILPYFTLYLAESKVLQYFGSTCLFAAGISCDQRISNCG